jgi:DNA-directed RNA polymerase subunit RPC12/RpoP
MQIVDLSNSGCSSMECPRCGRRTIVPHGESLYVCLNCGWRRDLSESSWNGPGEWIIAALIVLFFWLMFIDLSETWRRNRDQASFLNRIEKTIPSSFKDVDGSI